MKHLKTEITISDDSIIKDGDTNIARNFKGVWIKKELWFDANITPTEMKLLAEVDSLDHGNGWFASNKYLGIFLRVSEGRIANMISDLRKRGYVTTIKSDGRRRYLKANVKADLTETVKADLTELNNSDLPDSVNIYNSVENSLENSKRTVGNGKYKKLNRKNIGLDNNVLEVILYFNEFAGKKIQVDPVTASTAKPIKARLREGYTVEQCKQVIRIKSEQWKNDIKMKQYLRPVTLFSDKFESYLIEGDSKPKSREELELEKLRS